MFDIKWVDTGAAPGCGTAEVSCAAFSHDGYRFRLVVGHDSESDSFSFGYSVNFTPPGRDFRAGVYRVGFSSVAEAKFAAIEDFKSHFEADT